MEPTRKTRALSLMMLAASLLAGCQDSTGPSAIAGRDLTLEAVAPTSRAGVVGTDVVPVPSVRVVDPMGLPVERVLLTFRVDSRDGWVERLTAVTNADGYASPGRWRLGSRVGTQTLMAMSATDSVTFNVHAVAGGAYAVVAEHGLDQIGEPGQALPAPLGAKVVDTFGNPVAGVPVHFEVVTGGGRIEGQEALSDAGGIARPGPWTLGAGAVQHVRASSGAARADFLAYTHGPDSFSGRIAFVSWGQPGEEDIYLMELGAGVPLRLTTSEGLDRSPAWSPDGTRIAFASERGGERGIYTMLADGSGVEREVAAASADSPAWSPDGARIAFEALHDGSSQIMAVDQSDASVDFLATAPGYDGTPDWAPDGSRIAFVSDRMGYDFASDVFIMNADGSDARLLTQGDFTWDDLRYHLHPTWSPDGTLLAVVYGRLHRGSTYIVRFHVSLLSADGEFIKDVAWAGDLGWHGLLDPGSISWSPDGRGLAYTFAGDCGDELICRSLRYASLDGRRDLALVGGWDPSWTP